MINKAGLHLESGLVNFQLGILSDDSHTSCDALPPAESL